MKHIIKKQEPQKLSDWKAKANPDWKPTYDDLRGEQKEAVVSSLMEEQGKICCYCERRLAVDDSHIEHFRPQSDPVVDPLDYSNMLRSCQDHLESGEPRHCGNLKGDWFDVQLLVSPLDPSYEGRFTYTGDGKIRPADESDETARITIEKLGLNIPKLNDFRNKAIEPFLDGDLELQELSQFVTGYLKKDQDGNLGEFWTTIDSLFGSFVVQ